MNIQVKDLTLLIVNPWVESYAKIISERFPELNIIKSDLLSEDYEEIGEDMPAELDEVIDRLESGQSPEEIEESMPELAEGLDGPGLGGSGMGGIGGDGFVDL